MLTLTVVAPTRPKPPPVGGSTPPAAGPPPKTTPVDPTTPPTGTPSHIGAEVARFLLLLVGTLAPMGITLTVAAQGKINNPNFGVAVMGFFSSIIALAGAVAVLGTFVSMSPRARGVIITIFTVSGLIVWGVIFARSSSG